MKKSFLVGIVLNIFWRLKVWKAKYNIAIPSVQIFDKHL
ncbi:MAG: hypothetical protein RHS_3684 [Robinsoniella sp. RHS]|nr:MAG: hypothetical protein RHS_3684 [Robinsoniella sp. RHS]